MMKDRILLLASATICAAAAWAFWHYLDADAFAVLTTLVLVSVVVENMHLRRKLRDTRERG